MINLFSRPLIRLCMLLILCLSVSGIFAQDITVNGTVKDVKGEPLPSVNVTVKGTFTGRVTNEAGQFSIPVNNQSAVLEFTFVGYNKLERKVGTTRQMAVVLEQQSNNLQDVVVIGFGTQKKGEGTSAISTVKAADIVKAPVGDVTNALTGRIAGVMTRQPQGRPGASAAQIFIRGRASLNSAALIIVDGVERESFGDIDPNDIESISTLKDAASTALFGLKGANGVIVVTTKRGKIGETQIAVNSSVGLSSFGQRPEPLRSYESAMLQNEGEDNLAAIGSLTHPKYFSADDIQTFKNGTGDPLLYPDVDWFNALTKKAWLRTQHNLSFRGGSKRAAFYIALGYMFEDGMFKNFNTPAGYKTSPYAKRTNFRSNLDYNLTSTTRLSLNLAGSVQDEYTPRPINTQLNASDVFQTGSEGLFRGIYTLPGWGVPFFPEYTARSTPEMIQADNTLNQIRGVGWGGRIFQNPYTWLKRGGYSRQERNVLESTFILNQKLDFITEGLNFTGTFAYDQIFTSTRVQFGSAAGYIVNRNSKQLISASGQDGGQIDDGLNARPGTTAGKIKTNLQLNLNYTRQFGEHKVSGAAVATRELEMLAGGGAPIAFQGMVFKTAYNFRNKYFTEFNGSYQGSENLPKDSRYGFFPTVGLGYTITEEGFMDGIKDRIGLDYLKIRGSYGLVGFGNAGSRFLYLDEYSAGGPQSYGSFYFGNPGNAPAESFDPRSAVGANVTPGPNVPVIYHSRIGNPFVSYEKSTKRNLGIDAYFLNNKIQVTADIFDETRKDILLARAASTQVIYGEPLPSANYGRNYNQGYEAELKLNNNSGKFYYGLTFQFSHIKNKQLVVDEALNQSANLKLTGLPLGQFRGYAVHKGFYQSQAEADAAPQLEGFRFMAGDIRLVDINGDNIINALDVTAIGYSDLPQDQYSLEPYVAVKGWRLSALFQAVNKVSSEFNPNDNTVQYFPHQLDRWSPKTPNARYPAIRPGTVPGNRFFSQGTGNNAFNLQDASFIKLRNVELSWQLPRNFTTGLGMDKIDLSLTGQNLYTWTKFIGLDPENNDDRSVGFYVLRGVTYPNIRTFQFNLRANF